MTSSDRNTVTICNTNSFCFVLFLSVCYILMLTASAKAGSCSCPSCAQRDAVQRCACCVYRQYGKRSESISSKNQAEFPDDFLSNFDHGSFMSVHNLKDWSGDSADRKKLDQLLRSQTNSNQTPDDSNAQENSNFFLQSRSNINHTVLDMYQKKAKLVSMLMELMEENQAAKSSRTSQQMYKMAPSYHSPPEGAIVDLGQEASMGLNLMQLIRGLRR